jgi:hypothetical protein
MGSFFTLLNAAAFSLLFDLLDCLEAMSCGLRVSGGY